MNFNPQTDFHVKEQVAKYIRLMHSRGESPATSGNYSFRSVENPEIINISRSGVDKSQFAREDFIPINLSGEILPEAALPGVKTSDETLLHLMLYQKLGVGCVLHSHGVNGVVAVERYSKNQRLSFSDLEILKAFNGNKNHEAEIQMLVFSNSQDMPKLKSEIEPLLDQLGDYECGFFLRGHGLYTWGETFEDAKRHLEAFNYLFEYQLEMEE